MGRAFDIRRRPRAAQSTPAPTRRMRRSFGNFLFLIVLAGLLIAATSRINSTLPSVSSDTLQTVTPTPTATLTSVTPSATPSAIATSSTTETMPSPEPSPTPTPINKASLSISILNGSGIAGQANTLRAHLVSEGFSIRRIAVASDTRETTIIYYQIGKRAETELVAGFIPDRVLEFEENATAVGPDDILIIVGRK